MAKRRRLTAPDTSELNAIEEDFDAKPGVNPFENTQTTIPPIAKVSAEAAQAHAQVNTVDRVAMAKDQNDAEKWRAAEEGGRAVRMIPLDSIEREYLRRDRMGLDEDELQELMASVLEHGLRSPIEVAQLESGYGLISGYRRLEAVVRLATEGKIADDSIAAFVRSGEDSAFAYVSMIEENELRSNLTPYERGRIAVLAVGQGVFETVEEAVDQLYAAASKAKRSKVRSFAAVHEALGDMLCFPSQMSEKLGLKLAAVLRAGGQGPLRIALAGTIPMTLKEETGVLEQALQDQEPLKDNSRGGRPKEVVKLDGGYLTLGGKMTAEVSGRGLRIDLKGYDFSAREAQDLMDKIREFLK